MKKRILKLLIFLIFLYSADQIFGYILNKLYFNSKAHDIANIRYSIDSTTQEILIFGSSRAAHHYIPDTIHQYTGRSVYNCGIGGQGLAFSFIQIHETLKRYNPELIILDLSPNIIYDQFTDEKLKKLLPYHFRDTIVENVLTHDSWIEKFKFLSKIYPYNGTPYNILSAFFYYIPDKTKGYIPTTGTIKTTSIRVEKYIRDNRLEIQNKTTYFLDKIRLQCAKKNIPLILYCLTYI